MSAQKFVWSAVAAKNNLEDHGLSIMTVEDIF